MNSTIELAELVISLHKDIKNKEFKKLDDFSSTVKTVEKMFRANSMSPFQYGWEEGEDDCRFSYYLEWNGQHIIYVDVESDLNMPLLGLSAEIRLQCMTSLGDGFSRFDEFLNSYVVYHTQVTELDIQ